MGWKVATGVGQGWLGLQLRAWSMVQFPLQYDTGRRLQQIIESRHCQAALFTNSQEDTAGHQAGSRGRGPAARHAPRAHIAPLPIETPPPL